jgi:hypothetical protein
VPLRETLHRILTEFPEARKQPLEAHPLARFIRAEAEQAVTDGLGDQRAAFLYKVVRDKETGRLFHGSLFSTLS